MKRSLVALSLMAAACGGGDATGPAHYNSIAGTYAGSMNGLTQGVALQATFTLTITQNQASLGGAYSMVGQLTDGFDVVDLQGSGSLTGSIGQGSNPSVNFSIASGLCPAVKSSWSGAYDGTNRKLTLTGAVPVMDTGCQVVLNYAPMIAILER